jgi:hypothetical protein
MIIMNFTTSKYIQLNFLINYLFKIFLFVCFFFTCECEIVSLVSKIVQLTPSVQGGVVNDPTYLKYPFVFKISLLGSI